ncbi:MAG: hypothetical protein N0C81_05870 [Candidatus Thiodiazotropha lotti]|uniref:Uncharacterized protein n=1 Tax=Candidatus Thiodiazotropha lotti TaxID=2792787 RepID=A0A9E4K6X6_9GAMM|nr:hypothetical protein [Candidatus Thiodiazotropha lotti]ODC01085.1 hypothetical protein A3197_00950 [Candidatus Thiodiazotropha endoloripes]MCG7930167.1 hypothetical protein [Candidatus Thiodiazotropha lotti]MCG7940866.1 hypothetical protein [Candidatus Thiodiazotropha lotti]MCG7989177.1 hypothetical protein [Candidatus Thiodiazotropha lotti]
MLPIFVGLIMAMLFGLFSFMVYGLEGLIHYAWIDIVFWSLIVTGMMISLINELGRCLACRLKSWVKIPRIESFCSEADCRSLLS